MWFLVKGEIFFQVLWMSHSRWQLDMQKMRPSTVTNRIRRGFQWPGLGRFSYCVNRCGMIWLQMVSSLGWSSSTRRTTRWTTRLPARRSHPPCRTCTTHPAAWSPRLGVPTKESNSFSTRGKWVAPLSPKRSFRWRWNVFDMCDPQDNPGTRRTSRRTRHKLVAQFQVQCSPSDQDYNTRVRGRKEPRAEHRSEKRYVSTRLCAACVCICVDRLDGDCLRVAAYFSYGDYNIIIVDYGSLAREPCLSQIEWSPRFCAECIAQLVDYLAIHPRGVQPDELHLIGYSVGAHMAGLVANHISFGKLGRITGTRPNSLPVWTPPDPVLFQVWTRPSSSTWATTAPGTSIRPTRTSSTSSTRGPGFSGSGDPAATRTSTSTAAAASPDASPAPYWVRTTRRTR